MDFDPYGANGGTLTVDDLTRLRDLGAKGGAMTDAELNVAVCKALGWDFVLQLPERIAAFQSPDGLGFYPRDEAWAQSLDACFRDLVPEAEARQWELSFWRHEQDPGQGLDWKAVFYGARESRAVECDSSPARAICLAWLKTKSP